MALAVAGIALGSLLDPAFSAVSSPVRRAIVRGYDAIPLVPKPASAAARRLRCEPSVVEPNWGPPRVFYHWKQPSPILALDSIADNPRWGGFEGTFTKVRHLGVKGWCWRVQADVGDTLEFLVYVENSSDSALGKFARDLRLHVKKGSFQNATVLRAYLSAAGTKTVWSEATVVGAKPSNVAPVAGSARIVSNYYPAHCAAYPHCRAAAGPALPGNIWSPAGAQVGPSLSSLGSLDGAASDSFYVLFRARVEPSFR